MGLMGQVISHIVRCICGEAFEDEPNSYSYTSPNCSWTPPPKTVIHRDPFPNSPLHRHQIYHPLLSDSNSSKTGALCPKKTQLTQKSSQISASNVRLCSDTSPNNVLHRSQITKWGLFSDLDINNSSRIDTLCPKKTQLTQKPSQISASNVALQPESFFFRSIHPESFATPALYQHQIVGEVNIVKEIWMNGYSSLHKILLVGEGDFSFSACLAMAFGSATNIIATSLNSEGYLRKTYKRAISNISNLRSRGGKVEHNVDATTMASNPLFEGMKFDRIVYNFPHAGCFRETYDLQLQINQRLVEQFLINAEKMITAKGEIHVRHKCNPFFRAWNLELLGSINGLWLKRAVRFELKAFPGYHTKYGYFTDNDFDCDPSKTYIFGLAQSQYFGKGGADTTLKKLKKKNRQTNSNKKEPGVLSPTASTLDFIDL